MITTKSFFSSLEDLQLIRLPKNHERTYKDSSGKEFPTFECSGLCLSFTSNSTLYWTGRYFEVGYGESEDVIVRAILVDSDCRHQGKAKQAIRDITELADNTGVTLYLEPTPILDGKMPFSALAKFYKKFGFEQESKGFDIVLIRKPTPTDPKEEISSPPEPVVVYKKVRTLEMH